ncbi:MAG: ABC transporter permease [Pseudobutyrivibrio sp.]|nr:ABC transporter permease [Pseudobutyrivibrio sp.]
MSRLIRLEIRKMGIRKYIIASIVSIICILLFMTISLYDSATDPEQTKDAYESMLRMASLLITGTFLIMSAVLYAEIVIGEYKNRMVLIMYSYPIKREKLVAAKVILITVFVGISMIVAFIAAIIYLHIAEIKFDVLIDSVNISTVYQGLAKMAEQLIVLCIFSLIPFAVGLLKRSASLTIVVSVILLVLMQPIMGRSPSVLEFMGKVFCFAVIAAFVVLLAMRRGLEIRE